jgi:S1-C subfamily serine protease
MRTLLSITLLLAAVSASMPLAAQGRLSTQGEKEIVRSESAPAASEEEQRKALEDARRRLDEAAREVARLSTQLGRHERNEFVFVDGGPRRAILGVQLDPRSGREGARVLKVSPGGAAEEAGLQDGDIIVSLDGRKIAGDGSDRAVLDHMREVKPDQKVKVRVLRAGKNRDFVVVARPMAFGAGVVSVGMPAMGTTVDTVIAGMPQIRRLGPFWPGEFGGMELASITPKLGAYFGASEGVLVVQAPDNAAFKLEDGDVIQAIDGRKPDDGAHALRILRSYQPGEKLSLTVLRQRKPLTLAVTLPERRHFEDDMLEAVPGIPAMPPVPPGPPVPMPPSGAGGTGSFE